MTIDKAIAQAKERADKNSDCWKHCIAANNCKTCEKEHEQIAEWLEELKAYREIGTVEGYKNAIKCYTEEYMIRKSNKQYNKAIDDVQ